MFVSAWGSLGKANISEQRDGRVSFEFYFIGFCISYILDNMHASF